MPEQSESRNKVASLIDEYELTGLGDELVAGWTATGDDHRSLRSLADRFNRALLERRLADAGVRTIDGEVENIYRLLTDEEASAGDHVRLTRRLEREGVDPEALESEFVSYQTVRRYLQDVREASYERPTVDRREREMRTLQQLRGRIESVTETKLDQLRDEELTLGEFRTTVEVRVFCETCGAGYDVETLLDRGGCDCARRND